MNTFAMDTMLRLSSGFYVLSHVILPSARSRLSLFLTVAMVILCPTQLIAREKLALVVGISDYPEGSGWVSTHGAEDARMIADALIARGFKTTILADKAATFKGIKKALNNLTHDCQNGDMVIVHFSTHGQLFGDGKKYRPSVVPFDAPNHIQTKYHGEKHLTSSILMESLSHVRKKLGKEGILYSSFDMCHAGGIAVIAVQKDCEYNGLGLVVSFVSTCKSGFIDTDTMPPMPSFSLVKDERNLSPMASIQACQLRESASEGIFTESSFSKPNRTPRQVFGILSYFIVQQILNEEPDSDGQWLLKVKANTQEYRLSHGILDENVVIECTKGLYPQEMLRMGPPPDDEELNNWIYNFSINTSKEKPKRRNASKPKPRF